MTRRAVLQGILASAASLLVGRASPAASTAAKGVDALQSNWRSLLAKGFKAPRPEDKLDLSKEEWRKRLSPEQFYILREAGTERPGSSPLNGEKRPGIFVCAGCDLPLFTSEMKFESGTGWPSFFTTIPGAFATSTDYKLILPRTEYHCVRCGGHHGHVFNDGPAPRGQRWCNNGDALRFVPQSA